MDLSMRIKSDKNEGKQFNAENRSIDYNRSDNVADNKTVHV